MHPLDGLVIGLELEFGFDYYYDKPENTDEEDLIKIQEELQNHRLDILKNQFLPTLKKYFSPYRVEIRDRDEYIQFRTNSKLLVLTTDASVDELTDTVYTIGCELITSPMTASTGEKLEEKLRDFLKRFHDFIENNPRVSTTSHSGLHVNMSFALQSMSRFLLVVLATLYDTAYMIPDDDERKNYAVNALEVLRAILDPLNIRYPDLTKEFYDFIKSNRRDMKSFVDTIYNILAEFSYLSNAPKTKVAPKYVEFRVLGGQNYHKDIDNIIQKMYQFASLLRNAQKNIDRKAKELARKIYREAAKQKSNILFNIDARSMSASKFLKELRSIPFGIHEMKETLTRMLFQAVRNKDYQRYAIITDFILALAEVKQSTGENFDFFSNRFIDKLRSMKASQHYPSPSYFETSLSPSVTLKRIR